MCRNIEVANGQVNHVGAVVQVTLSGRSVLDDFDTTVEACTDGMGQVSQKQLAALFATSRQNITIHIANILKEKELDENSGLFSGLVSEY